MKPVLLSKLVIYALVVAAWSMIVPGSTPQDDLSLDVTIVTGEHSRDSGSVTTTLTIAADVLGYEETHHGMRSNLHKPVKKEYKLTQQDRAVLIRLLKEKHLLVTRAISKSPQQKGFSRYFEVSIRSTLRGKENSVSINASPGATELKADPLYQNSVSLIEELYKIINRTDPDITIPHLIN